MQTTIKFDGESVPFSEAIERLYAATPQDASELVEAAILEAIRSTGRASVWLDGSLYLREERRELGMHAVRLRVITPADGDDLVVTFASAESVASLYA